MRSDEADKGDLAFIGCELGAGGHACVYACVCVHGPLDNSCLYAVKVARGDIGDEAAKEQAVRHERDVHLSHLQLAEGALPLLASGCLCFEFSLDAPPVSKYPVAPHFSGAPALVFPLGVDLWEWWHRVAANLSASSRAMLLSSVALDAKRALDSVHQQGVVHCDLRPVNFIMVANSVNRLCSMLREEDVVGGRAAGWRLFVHDFGIAYVMGSDNLPPPVQIPAVGPRRLMLAEHVLHIVAPQPHPLDDIESLVICFHYMENEPVADDTWFFETWGMQGSAPASRPDSFHIWRLDERFKLGPWYSRLRAVAKAEGAGGVDPSWYAVPKTGTQPSFTFTPGRTLVSTREEPRV